ncbi:hypothetical protein ACQKJC_13410 [Priestia koreensis]|uniref:hypothetical protein n=1 Tax=Priestia koreensis TaxID=284581 RepID=UPI003D058E33
MNKINDILKAYAKANSDEYTGNDYLFVKMSDDPDASINTTFRSYVKLKDEEETTLHLLTDWTRDFFDHPSCFLEGWFYDPIPDHPYHGKEIVQFIISLIIEEIGTQPTEVYSVHVHPDGYYACAFEEYVFKANSGLYLFSMQTHD